MSIKKARIIPKEVVLILSLQFIGIGLLLAAGEVVVRVFWPEYRSLYHTKDSTGGNPVVKNSWGFRDVEHARQKAAGTRRVAIVGDSIAWGYSLALEETAARLLEGMLNERGPARYEVMNFSGVGRDPGVYLNWTDRIFSARPDMLVYFMCLNDVGDAYARHTGLSNENMAAAAGPKTDSNTANALRVLKGRWRGKLRGSALWSMIDTNITFALYRRGILRMTPSLPQFAGLFAAFGEAQWSQKAWALFQGDLDSLSASARRRGIPFVIVQFPYRFMLEGSRENPWGQPFDFKTDPFQRMKSYSAARGIPWVDLRAAFNEELAARRRQNLSYKSLMNGLDFVHLNAFGNEVAARAIVPALLGLETLTASRRTDR